jgi:serine phosphatase RsbU (regulator of sigma subunit)
MDAGEMLIVYTDGVTEASSTADEIFGRKRLHMILEKKFPTASETIARIEDDIFEHIGQAPQSDDITLLGLRRKEKS